ncbi:MAG: molybdopterin-synthase adenylyltransferase MoeB [Kofleriaceae bacterium]|nr:molybdopterin-synthase adenylyltransferase MoeB [Kofleriaceae bacterium]MCL4227086.1 molybdopterin-synthase adenylyltransferase MoeB [Myxococcales bacterium]
MPAFDALLADLRRTVREVTPLELAATVPAPAVVDLREPDELAAGRIPGAVAIPRGLLEQRVEAALPDRARPVVLYCSGGVRSVLAARTLGELGYAAVASLAGGFSAWKQAGLPVDDGADQLSAAQRQRYSRHLLLPEVGEDGQRRLLAGKVLCIGAGGLGSPASLYLAAAGVGTIGLVDDDVVDASNLQRQVVHSTERIGVAKVDSAARTLTALNPDVRVVGHRARLTADNALELVAGYDVIVDGADNFATRYLLNDVALRLGKPVIHASVFRFEGQLTVFPAGGAPCYRCLYPEPPPPGAAPSCQEAGVLGVLPGVMGVLQATEALKLLLGLPTIAGRLLVWDATRSRFRELGLRRDPRCATCGEGVDRAAIPLVDYVAFCRGT